MNHKHVVAKKSKHASFSRIQKSRWITVIDDPEDCTCRRCRRQKKIKDNVSKGFRYRQILDRR